MNKHLLYLSMIVFLVACTGKTINESATTAKLFPALGDAPLSNQFEMKINGREAVVEKMEKIDIPIHYTQLVYDESAPLTIEITIDNPIETYTISPQKKGLSGKVTGNTLTFTIQEASYLLVRINNMEDLFLLINPPVDYTSMIEGKEVIDITQYGVDNTGKQLETSKLQKAIDEASAKQAVLFFPDGIYRTGELYMRSNLTLYLSDGALIYGSNNPEDYTDKSLIRLDGISNFRLLGNGTIDGAGWSGLRRNGAREFHLVYASDCENIEFDGTVLRDPVFWNTRVYRSKNVHLKNIKVLNNRPYKNWTNTDGVDFDSSIDCSLVNSVIHAGDDNVVVKGLDSERKYVTEKILFDKILALSNSAATKIGTETCVEYFRDITFRNIDVVKCKRGMVINGFDSTRIENVRFENISIESFDFNGNEAPRLIDFEITDKSWRKCTGDCTINDITIENIDVMCNLNRVESQILGKSNEFSVRDVKIKHLKVSGKEIFQPSDIHLKTNEFVNGITIDNK